MSGTGDYISRETAIEAMYKDAEAYPEHTFWYTQIKALRNIPAADVQPVVFCGDCKRYFGKEDGGYTAGYCKRTYISVGPFDFCSRGEKETSNE